MLIYVEYLTVLKWLMSPRWQDWWGHRLFAETSKWCDISWETVDLYGTSTLYPYLSASLLTMPSLAPYRFLRLNSRTTRDMLLSLQQCAGDDLWRKWEFWRGVGERVMVQEKGEGQCSTAGSKPGTSLLPLALLFTLVKPKIDQDTLTSDSIDSLQCINSPWTTFIT